MYLLYNMVLILVSILAFPYYFIKMLKTGKYRKSFIQKIGFLSEESISKNSLAGENPIWIHAVSVGEVLSSVSIIKMIKKRYPGKRIILSTITETGNYTAKSKLKGIDGIIYFPLDYICVVKRVIDAVRPQLFIIVETDIWPNFLRYLKRRKVPSILINGRVSPRSYRRYRWFRFFFHKVFCYISAFSMQSSIDSNRIIEIGADHKKVKTTGNLKFEQEIHHLSSLEKEDIFRSLGLQPDQKVLIAGSTHKGEEELILDVFEVIKRDFPDLILVLAPRNPERFAEVENIVSKRNLNWVKRTKLDADLNQTSPDLVILDTIGELSRIYSIGLLVFVGGSLVKIGGHNLLEPAVYKKPILFGPYMHNFLEISRVLIDSGAGIQVKDKEEFISQLRMLLGDPSLLQKLGEAAYSVIEKNQGATMKNMEIIDVFMGHKNTEAAGL
ncbi:MAG: 3-deoxy-D-manno-octulosonic acid transferase [Thermodesulfobacteriota bacterium]|nr:3-deoxy-D-manno-octulosonic acid transferase [Thermodesulfobacteriota bacterium]